MYKILASFVVIGRQPRVLASVIPFMTPDTFLDTDAAAAAANALSVANTKADASTVSSLQSTVTSQGNTLTSQGNSITTLNNQIKGIGGDNLLPNSSFEEVSGTAGRAKHWFGGGTGPITMSLVSSAQPLSTVAQRIENGALAATKYIDIALTNTEGLPYPAVSPLKSYVLSVDARGLAGLTFCLYIQFLNGSGAVIAMPTSAGVSITETFTRYSLSGVAPSSA